MKKALNILSVLLVLLALLPVISCSKNEEDTVEPTSFCYISTFTLGTLTYYNTSTDEKGEEVKIPITYAGSYYPMAIDQIARQHDIAPALLAGSISSTKPLLVGTDPTIVPVIIAGEGNFFYRPINEESTWIPFTSGNTVDFSTPLVFRAAATDGSGFRDYIVTINIRSNDPNGYSWEQMMPVDGGTSLLEGRDDRCAIAWKEGFAIVSLDNNNSLHFTTAASTTSPTWSDASCTGADGADVRSLQTYKDELWMNTTSGALLRSADGIAWETVAQSESGTTVHLLAASPNLLYADVNNVVCGSEDGVTWKSLTLDADASLFPLTNHAAVSYEQSNGMPRVILAGSYGEETTTWNREEDDEDDPWVLISRTGDNAYSLPKATLQDASLVNYCGMIIAIGKTSSPYRTTDNGVTWKEYTELKLGDGQQAATDEHIAATVAGEHIWIITGSRIWRARLNSYGE